MYLKSTTKRTTGVKNVDVIAADEILGETDCCGVQAHLSVVIGTHFHYVTSNLNNLRLFL